MSSTIDLIMQLIAIIALIALCVVFPITAARVAYRNGRKGWAIAAIISIFLFAGWIVGLISLFVKPKINHTLDDDSIRKSQSFSFVVLFLAPVFVILTSLIIRSSIQRTSLAKEIPPTVQPTIQPTPTECSPVDKTIPISGEDVSSVFPRCNCLSGSVVSVSGKLCLPGGVMSNEQVYDLPFLPIDTDCPDGAAPKGSINARLSVGDEENRIKPVLGDFQGMSIVSSDGSEWHLGQEGEAVILKGTIFPVGQGCSLHVKSIETKE